MVRILYETREGNERKEEQGRVLVDAFRLMVVASGKQRFAPLVYGVRYEA